ncbi:MAG: hypothetical protein J6U68_00170 [Clostridia bacterium]|nr:hypothetical protein [Clostridia bacterium]
MKKTVRLIALAMVVAMLCLCLASCGSMLSGEYSFGDTVVTKTYTSYVFKGSKVTVEAYLGGVKVTDESFEGTYKIKVTRLPLLMRMIRVKRSRLLKLLKKLTTRPLKSALLPTKKQISN